MTQTTSGETSLLSFILAWFSHNHSIWRVSVLITHLLHTWCQQDDFHCAALLQTEHITGDLESWVGPDKMEKSCRSGHKFGTCFQNIFHSTTLHHIGNMTSVNTESHSMLTELHFQCWMGGWGKLMQLFSSFTCCINYRLCALLSPPFVPSKLTNLLFDSSFPKHLGDKYLGFHHWVKWKHRLK